MHKLIRIRKKNNDFFLIGNQKFAFNERGKLFKNRKLSPIKYVKKNYHLHTYTLAFVSLSNLNYCEYSVGKFYYNQRLSYIHCLLVTQLQINQSL